MSSSLTLSESLFVDDLLVCGSLQKTNFRIYPTYRRLPMIMATQVVACCFVNSSIVVSSLCRIDLFMFLYLRIIALIANVELKPCLKYRRPS